MKVHNQIFLNSITIGLSFSLIIFGLSFHIISARAFEFPKELVTLVKDDQETGSIQYIISHSNKEEVYMNRKDFFQKASKLEDAFTITLLQVGHDNGHHILEFTGEKKLSNSAYLQMKWVGVEKKGLDQYEVYLLVKIKGQWVDEQNALKRWKTLKHQLGITGFSPKLNLMIEKKFYKRVPEERLDKYAKLLVEELDGKITNKYSDSSQTILEGYSPLIKDTAETAFPKNNVQLAISNKAIQVGSPLLVLN